MINLKEKLTAIANKFRSVLGTTDLIYPETFVDRIDEVFEKGKQSGSGSGYDEGYDKALSDFWDGIQFNGNRTDYAYAFVRWSFEYIRPKYKVVPTTNHITQLFNNCRYLKKVEAEYFDLSKYSAGTGTSGNYYTFQFCYNLEEIEDIGLQGTSYSYTFNSCEKLHTIAVLRFIETTTISNATFQNCKALANITIDGVIATSINFQWCPLTAKSIESVISHLSDTVTGQTLTLNSSAVSNAFTDEEWSALEGTKTNWTISLV